MSVTTSRPKPAEESAATSRRMLGRRSRGRRALASVALFIGPLAVVAAVWQVLVGLDILSSRLTPAPSAIAGRLFELGTSEGNYLLWENLGASAGRVLPALAIASVLGVIIGVSIGLSRRASDYMSGILGLLLPLPAVAWTPVFVVSIGRGMPTMVTVLVLGAIFPILYNVVTGVQGINERQIWAMQSLGGNRLHVLFRVVLPCAWPSILAGLRLGVGHAWRTLVAVELLTSSETGLGALIFQSRASIDTTTMYASVISLVSVGLLIDQVIFRPWENRTIGRWG